MKLNKKANQVMAWALLLAMLILVLTAYVHVYGKTQSFTKKTGETQGEMIKNYDHGEKALIFVDQAAKYSIYDSIFLLAEKGAYLNEPSCKNYKDSSGEYILWEAPINGKQEECYPSESTIRKNLNKKFNEQFNQYAKVYTPVFIPPNNYDIAFAKKEDKIEITGIATRKIKIPEDPKEYKDRILSELSKEEQECLYKEGHVSMLIGSTFARCAECPKKATCKKYINEVYCKIDPCNLNCRWDDGCKEKTSIHAVTPSFKIEIPYDPISIFTKATTRVKKIKEKVQSCLLEGSRKPDDEDLETCSNIDGLAKDLVDITNYNIRHITTLEDYTLLFDIKSSLNNPYSNKELIIKFGIKFLDQFPPPATEIITNEENNPEKRGDSWYLTWKKNDASDVKDYYIYYLKIEEKLGGGEIPDEAPTSIEEMDNKESPIIEQTTEWKIIDLEGKYYFFIIAHDNAGNIAKEVMAKRIVIPEKETQPSN